jgi:uncharacterized repeat protein (TIGR01451 family)
MNLRNISISPLRLSLLLLFLILGLSIALPRISYAVFQPQSSDKQNDGSKARSNRTRGESVPGEILVRFREGAEAARATTKGSAIFAVAAADKSGRQISMQVESLGGETEIVAALRLARVAAEDTAAAIEALNARSDVLYAEPNFIRRKEVVPNDPRYSQMWGLKNPGGPFGVAGADIKAEPAWDITTGNRNMVVAVIDEGIDVNHQDLQANIWRNPGETAGNGIDDDGNGFVDDVNGYDFVHNDGTVYDGPGVNPDGSIIDLHGTHVAGTIGAVGNNGIGVVGVNWQASLMSLKFLGPDGGTTADLLRVLSYTKMMRDRWVNSGGTQGANIRVTNNSYGGGSYAQSEFDAIQSLNTSGILFVAAAGNDAENNNLLPAFPASYDLPNVISVAATDRSDQLSSFSNFGSRNVHVGAPGSSILSTIPGNAYAAVNGTSMASPHVAGVAALVLAQHPGLTTTRLRASILFGGAPISSLTDKTETGNRLDAVGALQNSDEIDVIPPAPITDLHFVANDGRTVSVAWTAPGDDGGSGQAALVEWRFTDGSTGKQFLVGASSSAPAGGPQLGSVNLPYQHVSGTLHLRVIDNAGNLSTASVLVSVDPLSASPYDITESPAEALSTGGTPLHRNFDDNIFHYELPFTFPFFEHNVQSAFVSGPTSSVNLSTNGTLYMARTVTPTHDAFSASDRLAGFEMVAGLWDDLDLSTSRRADADIYVVNPDSNRIIFRWQGVPCNGSLTTGQCTGGGPVNFEIEIRNDGTIITRYGDGNTNLHPVVGIAGGDLDSFVIASHTSTGAPVNLTNAPTITYHPRTAPRSADVRGPVSANPGAVPLGQNTTLTLNANNAGPNAAAGVKVQGFLPPDLTFVSCTTPQGACWGVPGPSGTRIFGELGTIATSGSVPVRVVVNATRSTGNGRFFDYVTTWAANSATYDPALPNSSTFTFSGINPQANPLTGATAIGAGIEHALAVVSGGNVIAWGKNNAWQLGDDTYPYRIGPVFVPGISNAVAVDGGGAHSVALKADGTVWAWGGNFHGELGDGSTTDRKTPAPVSGLTNVAAISVGLAHNVALRSDGTVWTWGLNEWGQLGDGSNTTRLTPVQVPGLSGVIVVSAGAEHTAVVKNDGTVWTWGRNQNGQLGDGSQVSRNSPVQVSGLTGMTKVAAGGGQGGAHTLALKNDGTVWAWGFNGSGALGDGTFMPRTTPVQTLNLNNVTAIAAGRDHSVALRNDGTVWNWGTDFQGQLGQFQHVVDQNQPIQTLWLSGVTAIATGWEFSLALEPGGKIAAWGQGRDGELGDGTNPGGARAYAYDVAVAQNFIDDAGFFVRQHYFDFLNRDAVNDPSGYSFWTQQIASCEFYPNRLACIELKRINVSAAFYLSIEFQETGYLVERIYKASYGDATGTSTLGGAHQLAVPIVRFNEFLPDSQTIAQGLVVGQPGWEQVLENNKVAFCAAFVQRTRFTNAFPTTMSPAQFVDALFANAGVTPSATDRNAALNEFGGAGNTADNAARGRALRKVAENSTLNQLEKNKAFVLMQYFGYLRRNPNDLPDADHTGYDFWLGKLNQFNGNFVNADMVKAFIVSGEYRHRFGP